MFFFKKHKEKEVIEISNTKKVDSSVLVQTNTEEKELEKTKESEQSLEESTEVNLSPGDSIEVINYDANGKKTGSKKYKGSGKYKNIKGKKILEKSVEKQTNTKTDHKSETDLSKRTHEKTTAKKQSVDKTKRDFHFSIICFGF